MSQLPAMPVWWADFFNKTDHLSNEEQWAYLKLMAKTWVRNCRPIADNDADIARLLNMGIKRWRHIRARIEPFFDLSEGKWRQPHLENVFREASQRKELIVSKARLGGIAKAKKINEMRLPGADPGHCPSTANQNQTQSKKDSEAIASGVAEAPPDPIKDLWDRGKAVLRNAKSAGSLIGKLRQQHGDVIVLQAIVAAETELPSDPASFLVGCCNRAKANGHAKRQSPADKLFEGAYRAAEAFYARQCADERDDREADEPLLDG